MNTTNVKSAQLNYDKYTANKYDRDIVNSIPFHRQIHSLIAKCIKKFNRNLEYRILDLGAGTAITSRIIRDILPKATFDLVDFSRQMLDGAKKKMGKKRVFGFPKYAQSDTNRIPKYHLSALRHSVECTKEPDDCRTRHDQHNEKH